LSLDRIEAQILRVKLAISTASGFRDGQGRGDAFHQALEALEQALPRAQPTVVPSP
jgi:hypothetical protein